MSNGTGGALPPPILPPELEAALQQAVNHSLGSLDSLRITLRRHVHAQRKRGTSLGDIHTHLRKLMSEVQMNADGHGVSDELATQIGKWTGSFFAGVAS